MSVVPLSLKRRPWIGVLILGVLACCSLCGCGGGDSPTAKSVCNSKDTKFSDPKQQAIVCYAGTFLVKMLSELNKVGARKTSQHVRFHLLPYIGGATTLEHLRSANKQASSPQNSNCTVCYHDKAVADSLADVRNSIGKDHINAYDELDVCYMKLTDMIMDNLPTNGDGEFLAPDPLQRAPFSQTVATFANIFETPLSEFTGCKEPEYTDGDVATWEWQDVCDVKNHGLANKTEAAVFCYVASFMSKMMWELTMMPHTQFRKTEQHVRLHFTPYMGGERTTQAIKTDKVSDPTCTACYQDQICAHHQEMWLQRPCCYDNSTTPRCDASLAPLDVFQKSRYVFNSLNVCYVPFVNYFMEGLPKSKDGHFLVPPRKPDNPLTMALKISKDIFATTNVRACGPRKKTVLAYV